MGGKALQLESERSVGRKCMAIGEARGKACG